MKTYFFTPQYSPNSSYINHFIQPDSIIPDYTNPQSWNRYSYVGNNPINFNDPTGHMQDEGGTGGCDTALECELVDDTDSPDGGGDSSDGDKSKSWLPNASGNNLEFNITAGIPLENTDHATIGLLYLSLGVVTDESGGVQFYYTTLDQKYTPGFSGQMGGFSGENGERDSAYGLGLGLSKGSIFGEDFRTNKFLGKGDSFSLGALPISGGLFNPRDKKSNWTGVELGVGGGFTMGSVQTDTKFIGDRIKLSGIFKTICRINGYCGGIYKE